MNKGALREFKADPMGNFRRFWEKVPDPPLIGNASPISELRGITEIPNQWRPAAAPGIAFVGDAAMVLDPIWGTGCGFAFLSADWLVEHTAPAFGAGKDMLRTLDRGLESYRKVHRSRTRWHYAHIASFSKVRDYNMFERLVFSAATRDAKLATQVLTYLSRAVGPFHLISPAALCRAAMVNLGAMLSGRKSPQSRSLPPVGRELLHGRPGSGRCDPDLRFQAIGGTTQLQREVSRPREIAFSATV